MFEFGCRQLDLYCAVPICLEREFSFIKSFGHLMQSELVQFFSQLSNLSSLVPLFLSLKCVDQLKP